MPSKRWQIYLTALSMLAGFLLAGLWLVKQNRDQDLIRPQNQVLIKAVEDLTAETSTLESRIDELRLQLAEKQQQEVNSRDRLGILRQELAGIKAAFGLAEVTGPGISLTLDDNNEGAAIDKKNDPANFNPENYIIHDKNVLYLVSELKSAGAKAIAVNGQRITTISDIRCVGTVILINSARLAPPYEITAIGSPMMLKEALEKGEELSYLQSRDYPIKLTASEQITVPAYKGILAADLLQEPKEEQAEGGAAGA